MVLPVPLTMDRRGTLGGSSSDLGVDSRQYLFSFSIDSFSAIPADFGDVLNVRRIRAGAFVPRGDPEGFGNRPCGAKVLLVTDDEMIVLPHPAGREPAIRVPLEQIEGFEWGQMLLLGWIRFFWNGGSTQIRYNRRSSQPIEETIREIELARHAPERTEATRPRSFGEPLNFKFECARSARLLPGEKAIVEFFRPAQCQIRRCRIFRRQIWFPGDLLLATSARLLWITERYVGGYTPYGHITHSAGRSSVVNAKVASNGRNASEIVIAFHSGRRWRVPVLQGGESDSRAFVEALQKLLRS